MLESSPWGSLLGMVVAAAVIIGLAWWVTRRLADGSRLQSLGLWQRDERLQVLAQTQIGKDQRLAVIQAGERFFLVGLTVQNISVVAEFSREEAQLWLREETTPEQTPAFRQTFADALKKRKQR